MHEGKFVFSQLMEFVPWRRFQTCVNRYGGDYKVGTYQCVEQFRVMAFAQLTYRHSLRKVEACLRVVKFKLYHMGIHSTISHSNLAHANHQQVSILYHLGPNMPAHFPDGTSKALPCSIISCIVTPSAILTISVSMSIGLVSAQPSK